MLRPRSQEGTSQSIRQDILATLQSFVHDNHELKVVEFVDTLGLQEGSSAVLLGRLQWKQ